MLRMGYTEVDITPNKPVETVGFNRKDNISRGVLKSLYAQVTVWEGEELCCLVTIDSLGFKKELSDSLREVIGQELCISSDKVMLCFSHCHSAPNVDIEKEYYEMVCKKIRMAVAMAREHLLGVYTGYGNAEVAIGVNRRKGNNSLDKRAGILKVCNAESGETELLILRITAHCNSLKRDNYMISPDFFGEIREIFGAHYHCPIMVIQGSAGNIAPKYFQSNETPIDARGEQYVRSENALMDMATEVLNETMPILEQIDVKNDMAIQMYSKSLTLYAEVPTYEEAKRVAKESKENCGINGSRWLEEVKRLNKCGIKKQEENVEIQYFRVGDWCLCGVPYELMVEFAIRSEQMLGNEFFYLNGYTNGCLSYFPTEEEFDIGGYEVYWSMLIYYPYFNRVFPFIRESATKLLDFVVKNRP